MAEISPLQVEVKISEDVDGGRELAAIVAHLFQHFALGLRAGIPVEVVARNMDQVADYMLGNRPDLLKPSMTMTIGGPGPEVSIK
jgi:hypothetical protein